MEKKCCCCKISKNKIEFNYRSNCVDGLQNICKICSKEKSKEYRRTKNGLISKIYSTQIQNSKSRGHKHPSYTKIQFEAWILEQNLFDKLYKDWVKSNYNKKKVPSVDRLDDYIGYNLNNIQLTTWEKNDLKGSESLKNGSNTKTCRAVIQLTLNGDFIKEHYSISQASRETKAGFRHISRVSKGFEKSSGGFKWMYKEEYYANLH